MSKDSGTVLYMSIYPYTVLLALPLGLLLNHSRLSLEMRFFLSPPPFFLYTEYITGYISVYILLLSVSGTVERVVCHPPLPPPHPILYSQTFLQLKTFTKNIYHAVRFPYTILYLPCSVLEPCPEPHRAASLNY
jgi:hypothetical protein